VRTDDGHGFSFRRLFAVAVVLAAALMPLPASSAPPFAPDCPIFPADNVWHADISGLPVHPRSDDWISSMGGPTRRIHPDFGPSGEEMPYGIPFDVVDGTHPRVQVNFDSGYPDESDPGPYPFGAETRIEGGPDATGDRHALMIDRDDCVLYELYRADWNGGNPTAMQGSVFDLRSNDLRPDGWTSADAAGLPIFAGTDGNDNLTGTPASEVICGLAGNDTIDGRGDNDTIKGGTGADRLAGGAGRDALYGAAGNDTLNTRDRVRRNDLANGGEGSDACTADRGDRKISCR
jgi:hypothetical protein